MTKTITLKEILRVCGGINPSSVNPKFCSLFIVRKAKISKAI